ncbi:MAG: response regulator [Dethiobacter sp.]|jgi:two-component system phosphate regulon response regulator PhoB|nr:response regulator [Dethiobacter sp.]
MARVLVIEDQPSIGMVFKVALSEEGHTVDVFRDGKSGMEGLAREPRPDIILVDLLMPGISGKDVVEKLQVDSRLRDIPVAIISGCIPGPDVLPREGSFQAFISKPFDLLEVVELVTRLTANKQICA